MRIAIPRETAPREARVALVPEIVAKLIHAGHSVTLETRAGERAGFLDSAYSQAGASIAPDFANWTALFSPAKKPDFVR